VLSRDHFCKRRGEDIVAPRGGVQVIPEQISIRVNGGNALGTGSNVCQGVPGGRGDDFIEERKDVQLDKMEMFAKVEVVQNIDTCTQYLVEEDTFSGRGN
jgi:hypothetical protein